MLLHTKVELLVALYTQASPHSFLFTATAAQEYCKGRSEYSIRL